MAARQCHHHAFKIRAHGRKCLTTGHEATIAPLLHAAVGCPPRDYCGRADESSHRKAQLADLQEVVGKLRAPNERLTELLKNRKAIDIQLAFHPNGGVPPPLQAEDDANRAQLAALTDTFSNLEQAILGIESRYRCQRETLGKRWSGQAPGSSACNPPACAKI